MAQISQFLRGQLLRTALRFVNFHGMAPHWFINFHGVSYWVALTNSSIQDGTHWFVNFHGVSYWALTNSSISMGSATEDGTHWFEVALTNSSTEDGTHWFVNFHGVNYCNWQWHSLICQFPWGQLLRLALTDLSISMGSTSAKLAPVLTLSFSTPDEDIMSAVKLSGQILHIISSKTSFDWRGK